jgi:hypothetical protein
MSPAPLRPSADRVWIVRWVREDGRDTKHRMFLRRHPARTFCARLRANGKDVANFTSDTTWKAAS